MQYPDRFILGSRNRKKCEELRKLFLPYGMELLSLADYPNATEVIEDGETFAENACKKASETATQLDMWVLAEDSGLCVDALQGAPGIYSARFAGEPTDDSRNNQKLMEMLGETPPEKRSAHYVCHIALSDTSGTIQLQAEGRCYGQITNEARGTNGFGYDPYFLIPEYHKTFGELSSLVKRELSHRAQAFRLFFQLLRRE